MEQTPMAQNSMPTSGTEPLHYAGFWIRFLAYVIDGTILGIISYIVTLLLGQESAPTQILTTVIGIAYVIGFWMTHAATPGKMLMGLKIVSEDNAPLTMGKCIIRYIGYMISAIVIGLGFIWIGIDKKKQGWHDKMAHTYVVRR